MFSPQHKRPARSGSEFPQVYPLKLDIQFFAEGDPPPPPPDGFFATLKDAFKANPHLQTEHKAAITSAVSARFASYDFDVDAAKAALAEKKQRDADQAAGKDTESQTVKDLKEKTKKLEDRTKALALEKYAGDSAKAKLIRRLASEQVDKLQLNDDMELDTAQLDTIVTELRTEFPDLFPVANTDDNPPPPPGTPPPPPARSSGSSQQTNNPPPPAGTNVEALVAETFKHLKDTHQI